MIGDAAPGSVPASPDNGTVLTVLLLETWWCHFPRLSTPHFGTPLCVVEICWLLAATLSLTRSSLEYPYPPPSPKPKTSGLRKSSTQPPCPRAAPNVPFRDQVEVCLATSRGKGKKMSKRESAGCCSWFSRDSPTRRSGYHNHHHHERLFAVSNLLAEADWRYL